MKKSIITITGATTLGLGIIGIGVAKFIEKKKVDKTICEVTKEVEKK